jgi:GMP synthase (glutamine-hydrolysing)
MLFKDEVRKLGLLMEVPQAFISRHPFPGPGPRGARARRRVRPRRARHHPHG